MNLRSLAARLFNRPYEPDDIRRVETADLNAPGDEPHYYIADRQPDGAFRVSHVTLLPAKEPGDFRKLMLQIDPSSYTLNEAIDLLSRIEKETGLFAGKDENRSTRLFVNGARPDAVREKLGHHYAPSEIATDMNGMPAARIMELKQSSFDEMQKALPRQERPQRAANM